MDNKEQLKQLLSNANALQQAMQYSATSVRGEFENLAKWASYKTYLRKYNSLAKQAVPLLKNPNILDAIDINNIPSSSDCTWPTQKEYFDLAYSNIVLLKSLLEGAIGYAEDETHNLTEFIQVNLRKVIFAIPEKEIEIQNHIEALIVGRGMAKGNEYDRETGRVKTSGKEFIPDFIFPHLQLCLEVKLSKASGKLKAIVDEINADIRAYAKVYERQLYVVYDVGVIRDEEEFKRDLETAPGVSVIIVKH